MNCIIEGCVGIGRVEEKGLCLKCASFKRFRLRAWRIEKERERESNRKRTVHEKVVVSAAEKQYRREKRVLDLTQAKVNRSTPASRFGRAKSLAKRRGLSWEISMEQYLELTTQGCHYCGGALPPSGVGLDRMKNILGYLPSNVVPCCTRCNAVKGPYLSYEEMVVAMQAIASMAL